MAEGAGLDLAKATCEQDHTWDVWGDWEDGIFTPEHLKAYLCPSCDHPAVRFRQPDQLA